MTLGGLYGGLLIPISYTTNREATADTVVFLQF
jgi:hypothetical protein